MKSPGGRFVCLMCFAMLGACSRDLRGTLGHVYDGDAPRPLTTEENVAPGGSIAYPYDLWIGRSLNHVYREADDVRAKIELVRVADSIYGQGEALFRVTNPGDRPILVWNVRQQISVPTSNGAHRTWETRETDYPGRGWTEPIIPAGGSVEFPMLSPLEGDWRVCLLYSREAVDSQAQNRRFAGTYESIGPRLVPEK